jgi:hypothetical protein
MVVLNPVDVALVNVVVPLKVFVFVHVFAAYVFGIVVDPCTNAISDVVENARPSDAKYDADVVENVPSAAPLEMHAPLIAKHPAAMLNPLAPVVVPTVVKEPTVDEPKTLLFENTLVDDAVVAKNAVDVALVIMLVLADIDPAVREPMRPEFAYTLLDDAVVAKNDVVVA